MRIKISKENDGLLYRIKNLYNFKNDGIVPRIALSFSLLSGKLFDTEKDLIPSSSDGKEFRDDKALFGTVIGDGSNLIIYKTIVDQHYNKKTFEDEFINLFKLHLNHGLNIWNENIENSNISNGEHIEILLKYIKNGLSLGSNTVKINSGNVQMNSMKEFTSLLSFELGKTESGEKN